jgi:hypothetical protein
MICLIPPPAVQALREGGCQVSLLASSSHAER